MFGIGSVSYDNKFYYFMMFYILNIDINVNEGEMYDIFKRLDYYN